MNHFMRGSLLQTSRHHTSLRLITVKSPEKLRYRRPSSDDVEDVEKYRKGGYHPIHLGDVLKGGRYSILHKLGYGGFSTVWLARDEYQDRLVSLKVLTADAPEPQKELRLLGHLDKHVQDDPRRGSIVAICDDFMIDGPNGTHLCFVSRLGGPSLSTLLNSPGEIAGTRRLRAPLARKISRQLARAVSMMHDVGIVHGDITAKNILLQLKGIDTWPTETIYQQFGRPVREEVFTSSGQKPDLSAPRYLVESASFSGVDVEYFSEQALLIDLGEAFPESSPPSHGVGTPISYCSPELIFEKRASRASDVWDLACTIFEIRSGFPLFESYVGSSTEVLQEMVRILGMPPEPLHSLWKKHEIAISDRAQLCGSTLDDQIREIGICDEESSALYSESIPQSHRAILEPPGRRITSDEQGDLCGLLRGTLDYTPEKRMSAEEVANHPWFEYSE
ncbi:protein kinase [Usnea florida]